MTALPSFPVDPGTLDAIQDTIIEPADGPTLDELLELLAGYTGESQGETFIDFAGQEVIAADVGRLYSREDVILALIEEVRVLRESVARWSRSWAAAAEALAPDWPKEPA